MKKHYLALLLLCSTLILFAQTPQWQWAQTGGGTGYPGGSSSQPYNDEILASTFDIEGNLIVGGVTTLYPVFDTIHIQNADWNQFNFFLAKYDKCGNLLWVRVGGGQSYDDISGLATDDSCNIYTMGKLSSYGDSVYVRTPNKDTSFLNTVTHQFSKFDKDGNLLMIKTYTWGTAMSGIRNSMRRLKSGNFLAVFRNTTPIVMPNFTTARDSRNFILFDSLFNVVKISLIDTVWRLGYTMGDYVMDENENIYFSMININLPSISVLSHEFNPALQATVFLIKTDTSFTIKDINLSGYYQESIGYLSYSNGYLYACGRNGNGAIFDFDTSHTTLSPGKFVALKIDTNLHLIWASRPSVQSIAPSYTYVYPAASKDNVYIVYQHRGNLVWDSANLTTPGNTYKMAMLRLNTSDGKCVKGEFTGGAPSSNDEFGLVSTDAQGNGYFTGIFGNVIGTPTQLKSARGGSSSLDFFILKWGLACDDTLNSLTSPAPSDSLVATGTGPQTIHVYWQDVSDYEQGFNVYRSPDGISNWTLIGSTGHNIAQYDDTNLNPNTVYWYKAAAYNSGGESGFTNTDSAQTFGVPCSAQIVQTHTDSVYQYSLNLGGSGPYTYQWSINGNNFSTGANPSDTLVLPGNYVVCVTVTDNGQCTATDCDTFTVVPNCSTLAVTGAVPANVQCNGMDNGSITISANGGYPPYQYQLNTNAYQGANLFSGLSPATYTLQVRDTQGCVATYPQSITITEPAALTVSVTHTDVSTVGGNDGTATATAGGGTPAYIYVWSNSVSGNPITGLTAGTYCLTVTDSHNCTATGCGFINQPGCAGFNVTQVIPINISCYGANDGRLAITATGGQAPYQYAINNGAFQSESVFTNLSPGTYTVQVRDTLGCVANYQQSTTITEPAVLTLSVTHTDVSTPGAMDGTATATVTGGSTPYTYNWTNGEHTSTITGLAAGIYCLTVADANACTAIGCDSITEPATCSTTINRTNTGGVYGFTTTNTGTAPYTYRWSLDGDSVSSVANLQLNLTIAGNYSVCVTVTDANNCTSTACDVVTIAAPVCAATINFTRLDTVYSFTTANTGVAAYTYLWSLNGDSISNSANPQIVLTGAGSYSVCVTVTDANNCTATDCEVILVSGINEETQIQAQLFPNPAGNYAQLLVAIEKDMSIKLTVTDLAGRVVKENTLQFRRGKNLYDINCSTWAAGIYHLQLSADGISWSEKMVKQ